MLAAQFAASFTLAAMAVVAVAVGLTVSATALGGVIHGQAPSFDFFAGDVAGPVILTALQVIMPAGFGALAAQTAVAVAAFLVAPTLWAAVGNAVFGANSRWLLVFHAYDRLYGDRPSTDLPPALTAIVVWVVLADHHRCVAEHAGSEAADLLKWFRDASGTSRLRRWSRPARLCRAGRPVGPGRPPAP